MADVFGFTVAYVTEIPEPAVFLGETVAAELTRMGMSHSQRRRRIFLSTIRGMVIPLTADLCSGGIGQK